MAPSMSSWRVGVFILVGLLSRCFGLGAEGSIIPIIDLTPFFNGDHNARLAVAHSIADACVNIGFFVLKGHNVPQAVIDDAWGVTQDFFDLDLEQKIPFDLDQHVYPFGYTKLGGEILSTGKSAEKGDNGTAVVITDVSLPDLKEMFSVGPSNPLAGYPTRIFPSNPPGFAKAWKDYYEELSKLADTLLEAFALALNLPADYFKSFTDHHASALRALNYPELKGCNQHKNQYRASAHTDYGIFTILRADGPGLQVSKDKNPPTWHDAPVVEDGFIVNLGDLMKRWTNDRWLSTLHRVVVTSSDMINHGEGSQGYCDANTIIQRRQSMAFFYNVNKDAIISNLNPEESKYEPIIAGDFLMAKHLAATGAA